MIDMLENSFTDIASTVTDALITSVGKGRKVRMCGVFVDSPLRWAICAHPRNDQLKNVNDLQKYVAETGNLKVGISRLGSGSHTMAFVLANDLKFQPNPSLSPLNFLIADNFTGLRNGKHQRNYLFGDI